MIAHRAYGLAVASTDRIPWLHPGRGPGIRTTVEFAITDRLPEPGATARRHGWETLWRTADGWRFRFDHPASDEGWTMHCRRAGEEGHLEVHRTPGIGHADVAAVVETIGLATILHLLGVPVLHGCAVTIGDRAILLLGESGSGKSTTAAALVGAGHRVLSDDVAALDGGWVQPGPNRLRVNADTGRTLGRADPPRVFSSELLSDKRFIEGGDDRPRRLSAIYVLGPRATETLIEPISGPPALKALLSNVYGSRLLAPADDAHLLPVWARTAASVPIRRLRVRDDLAALPELSEAFARDSVAR